MAIANRLRLVCRLDTVLILGVLLAGSTPMAGCRRNPPPVATPTPTVSQPVTPAPATPPVEQPAAELASSQQPAAAAPAEPIAEESAAPAVAVDNESETTALPAEAAASPEGDSKPVTSAEATETTAVAEPVTTPHERIILLTQDGPLVIDIRLAIDGEQPTAAFEQLIDAAFAAADADGDGQASWTETLDNPRFAYGQFGNLAAEDESQRSQIIEMYDNNRNGLVERAELPRFITRNAGGSRSFSLTSSNEFRGDNRSRSPVRRLVDVDHDGAITEAELAGAVNRLLERDADDDEILTLADIKDVIEQPQPEMSNRRRTTTPDTAIWLNDRIRWQYVAYTLQELYAFGERIGPADVPLTPTLIDQLDQNGNMLLDDKEVPGLQTVPPHMIFEVAFFNHQSGPEATPGIRLVSVCPELESLVAAALRHPTRLSMNLPGAEIEFFVNDDPSLSNSVEGLRNQFAQLDGDKNKYLEEGEYNGQLLGMQVPFAALDADGNGMVFEEEITALVEQRQAVIRSQIRARAADQEDALFTALDTNGDGRLTSREVHKTPDVLRSLDRNQDGQVQSHELPGSMALAFVRGDPQQINTLFAMPVAAAPADEKDLPRWFIGTDTNRDGDISPREFLGPREKFTQLDSDQDGFISRAEAMQPQAESAGP